MIRPAIVFLVLFATLAAPQLLADDLRDEIVLKNGKKLQGRILVETADKIQLLTGTKKKWIDKKTIRDFQSIRGALQKVVQKYIGLRENTKEELLSLAEFSRKSRLPHEEQLFYWSVLLLDQQNDLANEKLSHHKTGEEWKAKAHGSWIPIDKLDAAHSDWSKAWRLRSEHFSVRCNHSLRRTLDTLFELEAFYMYFYQLFEQETSLPQLTDPIEVYVYKDDESFPSQGTHAGPFFNDKENILYTYVEDGVPLDLFKEATQGLFHNLVERATGSRGKFPAWLDEAWADHMGTIIVSTNPGKPQLEPARTSITRFRAVAETRDPFSITRILNFEEADYLASSKQNLKYGQGYTLFHYLLKGDGKYHDKFMEYIRQAILGKGQSSTFNKIFKRSLKKIEVGHLRHAQKA